MACLVRKIERSEQYLTSIKVQQQKMRKQSKKKIKDNTYSARQTELLKSQKLFLNQRNCSWVYLDNFLVRITYTGSWPKIASLGSSFTKNRSRRYPKEDLSIIK